MGVAQAVPRLGLAEAVADLPLQVQGLLAAGEGLSVVAEGVENDATLERLRTMNCDMVQGFLVSRPLGAAEIPAWLRGSVWCRPLSEARALRRVV